MGRLRGDQITTQRHTVMRSLGWRGGGGEAGQGRLCGELSLSHPRAACVYGAVSHVVRPLPGDTGHQGDEKIIAPSVGASRDRGLMDTAGN